MRYIAHIPLAGGFALGNMNITDQPPVAITSYSPFESNDLLYRRYLKKKGYDVPYYVLDKLTDTEKQELSKYLEQLILVRRFLRVQAYHKPLNEKRELEELPHQMIGCMNLLVFY